VPTITVSFVNPVVLVGLALFLAGCGEDAPDAQYVRLHNTTDLDFIRLNIAGLEFGALPAGATSPYLENDGVAVLYSWNAGDAETIDEHIYSVVYNGSGAQVGNGRHTFDVLVEEGESTFGFQPRIGFQLQ